jgi:uncharacterized protein (TIGR03437 family)
VLCGPPAGRAINETMDHRRGYVCLGFLFSLGLSLWAQLLPPGTPVPRKDKPPVVFLNGFQASCDGSSFAGTFGQADKVLEANGEVSLFFDNCRFPGSPPIETLGIEFGKFLAALKYEDGQPVQTVDAVAHSMGGLILRSYLAGKQPAPGAFQPPAAVAIRKAVFFATPHFGTGLIAALGASSGQNAQIDELASGSQFLFDLATWNQGTDDLRGVDALSVIGNGGTGILTIAAFDDGVVTLTSGSIAWALPGRTRIIPYCHTLLTGIASVLCKGGAPPIAQIQNATDSNGALLVSFLNGAAAWQTIGAAPEDNPFLSANLGLLFAARNPADEPLTLGSATATYSGGDVKTLNVTSNSRAYNDLLPSGAATLSAVTASGAVSRQLTLPAGSYLAAVLKQGPNISRIYPAASRVSPLSVAPGTFASIYGDSLASQTEQAATIDYPNMLGGAQVTIGGVPLPLQYASPSQINSVIPDDASGLVTLTVKTGAGRHTVNLLIEPAVPAIFTQDSSGTGPASALNWRNNALVTPSNPLRAGDYLELFLTGLGSTTRRGGLDYANLQPSVIIAGKDCPVSYAGRAPGYRGLDQINCLVPAGLSPDAAAPVQVISGARASNVATVAVN